IRAAMANPFRPVMSATAAAISTWHTRESSVSGDPGDLPTFAGSAASFDSGAKKGEEDNAADWRRRTGARLVVMPDQVDHRTTTGAGTAGAMRCGPRERRQPASAPACPIE